MASPPATIPVSLDSGDLILSTLEPMIFHLDEQVRGAKGAQLILNEKIISMSQYLHDLNESEEPYDIDVHVMKLQDVRLRMTNVSEMLTGVHDRLSRLQRQMAREIYKKKQQMPKESLIAAPEH